MRAANDAAPQVLHRQLRSGRRDIEEMTQAAGKPDWRQRRGGSLSRMRSYVISCFLVALVVGAADAKPVPRPAAVIAKVTIGSPAGLDGVRAFADAIRPGTSDMIHSQGVLASAFGVAAEGLDLAGPVHVLYVDNGKVSGGVLVARVADATLLAPGAKVANGWAVAGDSALTKLAAGWALGALAATSPPAEVIGTVYPGAVLARYRKEIEQARASSGGAAVGLPPALVDAYWAMIMSFSNEIAEVVVRVDASKELGAIDLTFVPKPRSRLAKFVALQKPNDFSLLGKLPASNAGMVGAGRLVMGPYRKGFIELMQVFYGPLSATALGSAMDALMKAASGESAMAMGLDAKTGMAMDAVYALEDMPAADAAIARMFKAVQTPMTTKFGAITSTVQTVPETTEHAGVTVRAYETTTTGGPSSPMMPPGGKMRVSLAMFDNLLLLASKSAPHAIDAARGKSPGFKPTRYQAALFDRARARKDSMAFVLDVGAVVAATAAPAKIPAGSNMLMSLGFADRSAHFSFAIPATVIKSMMP